MEQDQAAADLTADEAFGEEFPLGDEEIPDFVMEYLQSEEGQTGENIPDHILEYIQSRAAALERSRQQQQFVSDEIYYTQDEVRILDDACRRLEEQGEKYDLPKLSVHVQEGEQPAQDEFDHFFQRTANLDIPEPVAAVNSAHEPVAVEAKKKSSLKKTPIQEKAADVDVAAAASPEETSSADKRFKINTKFDLRSISMPPLPAMPSVSNLKMPKFVQDTVDKIGDRFKSSAGAEGQDEGADAEGQGAKPKRRNVSSSPLRQKIHDELEQQKEAWNNRRVVEKKFSLSDFKIRGRNRVKEVQDEESKTKAAKRTDSISPIRKKIREELDAWNTAQVVETKFNLSDFKIRGRKRDKEAKSAEVRRTESISPMRQKIREEIEGWNKRGVVESKFSLKDFKIRGKKSDKDGQVKGFVALLPGVFPSRSKSREPENQYEEVHPPPTLEVPPTPVLMVTAPDGVREVDSVECRADEQQVSGPDSGNGNSNEQETMDDVDNLPESEVMDHSSQDVESVQAAAEPVYNNIAVEPTLVREDAVDQEMSEVEPQVTEPEPEVEQKTLPESVLELSPSPVEPVEEPVAVVVESKVEEAEKIVAEVESEPILELSPLPLPQLPPEPVSDVHIFIQQPSLEIVDREVADVVMEEPAAEAESSDPPVGAEEAVEVQEAEEAEAAAKPATFADRSRMALQATKSKIQTTLSKDNLQATRKKLQTTRNRLQTSLSTKTQATRQKLQNLQSTKNLQAAGQKIQSTLSKQNLQATGQRIQTKLSGTLSKRRKAKKGGSPPAGADDEQALFRADGPFGENDDYETSTPKDMLIPKRIHKKKSPESKGETTPKLSYPTAKRRTKRPIKVSPHLANNRLVYDENLQDVEEVDDELELKSESQDVTPSISRSAGALAEDQLESDKENEVVVRPKRHRYSSHRQGFHEDFTRPQSAHYESDIKSSWVDLPEKCPSMSQDLADAFSIPVNTLEAITGLRKPERPSRSRSNRSVNILADQTATFPEYENTMYDVPPRRIKRLSKSPVSRPDWNQTWPRKDVSADKPAAPKRAKPHKPVAGNEYPTWPRRSPKSSPPPLAPKRARSKNQIDVEEQIVVTESVQSTESEPVVAMETEEVELNIPVERPEVEAVAEEVKIVNTEAAEEAQQVKITNVEVAVEEPVVEDVHITSVEAVVEKPVVEPQLTEVEVVESVTNEEGEPFVAKRRRTSTDLSLSEPPVPVRSKRSSPRPSESEGLEVEKSMQGVAEPASTPSEVQAPQDVVVNEQVMQGLDQLLEILATQQSEQSPTEETPEKTELVNEDEIDESGYAEIKQFQNKTPPPRPPPPSSYSPASEPSDQSPYSYIYTVPRRKAKYQTISSSPERPPRTYCTIRPHRPPRKTRTQTTDTNHLTPEEGDSVRRHSFSSSDEQTRTERDLQSAPVVERMRTRPLPAPPRTKRRNSNQPPPKDEETTAPVPAVSDVPAAEEVEEPVVPVTETAPVPIQSNDEYEPIETKAEVEEVSIGIQTDPVPEDEEAAVEVSEATDLIIDQPAPEAEPEPAPEEMDGLVEGKLILGPIEVVIPQLEQVVQVEQVISTPEVLPVEVSSPVEVISPPEVSAPAEVVSPSTEDVVPVEIVPPPAEVVSPPVEPPPSEVVVDVVCPPEVTSTEVVCPPEVTEVVCPQAETVSVPVDVVCPPQIVSAEPEVVCQPVEDIVVECPTTDVATPPEVTCPPVEVTSAPVEVVSPAPEVVCQPAEVIASVEVECPTTVAAPEVACLPEEVVSAPVEVCPPEVLAAPVEPECPPAEIASPPVEIVRPPSPIAPPTVPPEEVVTAPVSPPVPPPRQEAKHTKTKANLKEEEDDELDSYSRIPPNFPLPPVRLQLSALDVDRLNVREVQADRLVVSSFDTNTLQVSQLTCTSNDGQPMVFNLPAGSIFTPESSNAQFSQEDAPPVLPLPRRRRDASQRSAKTASASAAEAQTAQDDAPVSSTESSRPDEADGYQLVKVDSRTEQSTPRTPEPSIGDLTLQLAAVSGRHLVHGATIVGEQTYDVARRVARFAWDRLNAQMRQRGICLTEDEEDNLKAVLLLLLMVVAAIFLLGMGRQQLSYQWEFQYL